MCCNVVLPLLTYIQIKAGKNETQGAFYTKATPKLRPCRDKVTPRATRNSKITKTSSNVTPTTRYV